MVEVGSLERHSVEHRVSCIPIAHLISCVLVSVRNDVDFSGLVVS